LLDRFYYPPGIDRVLKGANPVDFAVMRPTTFEPVINLKTVEALGLAISNSMQLRWR
jgi:putative ABC transport system substrate-binding protein